MEIIINTGKSERMWTANGPVELVSKKKVVSIYNPWEERARQVDSRSREEIIPHFEQGVNVLIGGVVERPGDTTILSEQSQ